MDKLGPICSQMMRDPSPCNAKVMMELISQASPSALQTLQKGMLGSLIEPLVSMEVALENKRHIVECITHLLRHTHVFHLSMFWTIYSTTFVLIYDDSKAQTIDAHEELKLSIVKCVTVSLKQASTDVITELYIKSNVPRLAKCVYICKKLVHSEKFSTLRVAAIKCIMTVAYVHEEADDSDVVLRKQVGDVVMFILPGILALLRDVILEGDTTPHKVKVIALRAWSRIVAIVMEDFYATDSELDLSEPWEQTNKELETDWNVKSKDELLIRLNASVRSHNWYQAAAEMISKSFKPISVAQLHPHWNVRRELALGCTTLVSKCARNMEPAARHLLDVLVVLANDNVEAVSAASQEGLKIFANKLHKHNGRHLLTVVEESFYSIITSMPRVLKGMDDGKQLTTLSLLIGYMKLLGKEKLSGILLSNAHLGRLMSMLIQAFELDNVAVQFLDDCSIKKVDPVGQVNTNISWRIFKRCSNPVQLAKLVEICKLLATYADVNILSSYLLDYFSNSVSDRKEITLILNEILGSEVVNDMYHAVENVIDAYLEFSIWSEVSLAQTRSDIIQICLILEGIGKMVKTLGTSSTPLIRKVLFPVLERAGSTHELVALFGSEALYSIAATYGHQGNAAFLINANIDYLSSTISQKLRRADGGIRTLNVLQVMIKHSTSENLPHLKVVLEKAIKQSYSTYQMRDALLFLQVLEPLMVSLRYLLQDDISRNGKIVDELTYHRSREAADSFKDKGSAAVVDDTIVELEKQVDHKTSCISRSGKVVDEILTYHRLREASHSFKDEGSDAVVEDTIVKEKSPLRELAVSVMQRCIPLVSAGNRKVTLLVLSILGEGIIVLKDDEDELLPLVHQIWQPLLTKLSDFEDHMVVRHSFKLLLILAQAAKSFIRYRTLQQVLPCFLHFLSSNVENSKRKDNGRVYRFTQLYKLQLEMLEGLGYLAIDINLQEREVWKILEASGAYLDMWQPLAFQDACVELYAKLAVLNKEAVWLKLTQLFSECQELRHQCRDLKVVRLASRHKQEYERNVKRILAVIS